MKIKIAFIILVCLLFLVGCEEKFMGLTESEAEELMAEALQNANEEARGMFMIAYDAEMESKQTDFDKIGCTHARVCDNHGGLKYGFFNKKLYCKCNNGKIYAEEDAPGVPQPQIQEETKEVIKLNLDELYDCFQCYMSPKEVIEKCGVQLEENTYEYTFKEGSRWIDLHFHGGSRYLQTKKLFDSEDPSPEKMVNWTICGLK